MSIVGDPWRGDIGNRAYARDTGMTHSTSMCASRGIKHLLVETTTVCNLRCPGCYMSDLSGEREEFSAALFQQVVNATQPQDITFLGGEPLLWPHLAEAVSICRQRNLRAIVATNLTLMTEVVASFLNANDVMVIGKWNVGDPEDGQQLQIQARLVGSTVHDVERMRRGLRLLRAAGFKAPNLSLENFVRKENVPLVAGFLEFCARSDAHPYLEVSCQSDDLTNADLQNVIQQVQRHHQGTILPPHFISRCNHSSNSLYVRPNGDLQACSGSRTVLANIVTDPGAIHRAQVHELVETRARIVERITGPCQTCSLLERCRGGCRAYAERTSPTASYLKCWRIRLDRTQPGPNNGVDSDSHHVTRSRTP